jgi:hypothetical protein
MRHKLLAVLIAATIGLLGAQTAFAAVASQISIRWNPTTERFHGKVTSTNAECVADRIVKLFKETASGPALQGKTHTNTNGAWRIEVMNAHGKYFAKTPQQKVMGVTCGGDRSKTIDVM